MVIARPVDFSMTSPVSVQELDAAADIRNFVSRKLNTFKPAKCSVSLAMPFPESRTKPEPVVDQRVARAGNPIGNTANNNGKSTGDFGSTGNRNGSNSFGSNYGGGGMGGGGSFGTGSGLQSKRQAGPPTSLVLGKTLVSSTLPRMKSLPAARQSISRPSIKSLTPLMCGLNRSSSRLSLASSNSLTPKTLDRLPLRTKCPRKRQISRYGRRNNQKPPGHQPNPARCIGYQRLQRSRHKNTRRHLPYGTLYDNVNVVLSALSSNSDFKVLSRPSVFTLNNEPASIETGQQIPVPASTYSSYNPNATTNTGVDTSAGQFSTGFQSNIQYMDVSLRLDVVPVINSEEDITLQIKQVNKERGDSIAISGNNIPTITNQGLERPSSPKTMPRSCSVV